jgi:hypothetical protein
MQSPPRFRQRGIFLLLHPMTLSLSSQGLFLAIFLRLRRIFWHSTLFITGLSVKINKQSGDKELFFLLHYFSKN